MSAKDTQSVNLIKQRANRVHGASKLRDSIFEIAEDYFIQRAPLEKCVNQARDALNQTETVETSANESKKPPEQHLLAAEQALATFDTEQEDNRTARLEAVSTILDDTLSNCCEEDGTLSHKKIAKQLSVLFLSTTHDHIHATKINTLNKPLYRGLLSLVLLQELLDNKLINNLYIVEQYRESNGVIDETFKNNVMIPLLLVSMCCDVGNQHPDSKALLNGENNDLDPHRILPAEDRNILLKDNYKHTIQFLSTGLGMAKYVGNSKQAQLDFDNAEQQKNLFIRTLVKSMYKPEQGVGNLIKVPQIYVSVILNNKASIPPEGIPKVYQLLEKHGQGGKLSKSVIESMRKITGDFPMGYGIAYIPKDPERNTLNQYEYAIVNHLYPTQADTPICRGTTRNMTFNSAGVEMHITPDYNLYFPQARKKLETISKKRLEEILRKLWSNFESRPELAQIVPRCWQPYEYFSNPKYQNLWNTVDRMNN